MKLSSPFVLVALIAGVAGSVSAAPTHDVKSMKNLAADMQKPVDRAGCDSRDSKKTGCLDLMPLGGSSATQAKSPMSAMSMENPTQESSRVFARNTNDNDADADAKPKKTGIDTVGGLDWWYYPMPTPYHGPWGWGHQHGPWYGGGRGRNSQNKVEMKTTMNKDQKSDEKSRTMTMGDRKASGLNRDDKNSNGNGNGDDAQKRRIQTDSDAERMQKYYNNGKYYYDMKDMDGREDVNDMGHDDLMSTEAKGNMAMRMDQSEISVDDKGMPTRRELFMTLPTVGGDNGIRGGQGYKNKMIKTTSNEEESPSQMEQESFGWYHTHPEAWYSDSPHYGHHHDRRDMGLGMGMKDNMQDDGMNGRGFTWA